MCYQTTMAATTQTNRVTTALEFVKGREIQLLVAGLFLVPVVTGNFQLSTHILIFGLFAMGYNISLGETGMLTFGHAAFFGLGAYGAGLFLVHVNPPPWLGFLGILVGVLLATLGGLVIGLLSLRRRGTYLALITLAFQQMIYFIIFQWEGLTGGDDGLFGIAKPTIGIPGVFILRFDDVLGGLIEGNMIFYWFVLFVFGLALLAMRYIKRSHFGHVLNAIRENEDRAKFLGYDIQRYRLAAFVVSAAFSGLGGALYPMYLNFVGISTLNWVLSGEVNFFVLLGGMGAFLGPAIGTFSYYWIVETLSSITEYWHIPVGLILIGIVLFLPEGMLGAAKERAERKYDVEFNQLNVELERFEDDPDRGRESSSGPVADADTGGDR